MKKTLKFAKDYWFILVPMAVFAVWLITINTRTFDSSEQKVKVVSYVESSTSPEQQAIDRIMDSLADDKHIQNDNHAIQIRQKRYDDGVKKDSIDSIKDSLFFDIIKRNADQFYQIKQTIDSIKEHHE